MTLVGHVVVGGQKDMSESDHSVFYAKTNMLRAILKREKKIARAAKKHACLLN